MGINSLNDIDQHFKSNTQPPLQGSAPYDANGTVDTFLGRMPNRESQVSNLTNPDTIKNAINTVGGMMGGGFALKAGKELLPVAQKAIDYLNPGKAAEEFRSSLGDGTSSENIANLSQRAQLAKGSRQQEALIPKEQLYAQEGKSDVYKTPESSLPEGNIPKVAETIAPGEKYGTPQAEALSKAMADFRKGKVNKELGGKPLDTFLDKAEEIFNVPELPEKAADKIEDMMSMPTSRDSKYFSDPDVSSVYSPKGKLNQLHNDYENKPTLDNYDSLQSALKKELRSTESRAKVSDTAQTKVEQLQSNIKNLNSDKEGFMKTLPENMQNLENDFRNKYQSYAQTYEKGNKETGASLTLRRLAEGRHDQVTDSQVVKLFSNPTASDKAALMDMGTSAARNAIYSAMQKIKPGDASGIANTVLDLKRTKGFGDTITPQMEQWANGMLKQIKRANLIKGAFKMAGGAAIGGEIGGPTGALIGATAPFMKEGAKTVLKKLKK